MLLIPYPTSVFPCSFTLCKKGQLSPSARKSSHQVNKNISLDDFIKLHDSEYFYEGCLGKDGTTSKKSSPPTLPKLCQIYPTVIKLSTVIQYLKKIQKAYKLRDKLLGL